MLVAARGQGGAVERERVVVVDIFGRWRVDHGPSKAERLRISGEPHNYLRHLFWLGC